MFAWYQRSAGWGHAYLAAVRRFGAETRSSRSSTAAAGGRAGGPSRERIAPATVLLVAADRSVVGRKDLQDEFASLVSRISDVGVEVPRGRTDPLKISIAARTAWASSRRTSRREDVACCFMGFFGFDMPLPYGEGSRAFARLQGATI